ncbi:class I SAM-dependent methyltransferase [Vibrio aphrogenes]|uniref:class I SAM-dependent methyltransferase n=1 Tax=Vibrio aphrogenes TaxID=1891186 RepID=UPI000B363992|nr:class I SAM-dependent methyltransferase [Vibrio aphrogenes]
MLNCPLCESKKTIRYYADSRRQYLQCQQCQLVFVHPEQRVDAVAEKAVYDLHENNPQDAGYRRFLSRMADPILQRIAANSHGLDFGCGPGPALAMMLEEQGHQVALYDHYYYPDKQVLNQQYDFVTATEVIEHLFTPNLVWQQWLEMLKPGGWLGVMTKLVKDVDAFATWHYRHDPTHVVFFSRATFEFLAQRDQLQLEFIGNDVMLLKKAE